MFFGDEFKDNITTLPPPPFVTPIVKSTSIDSNYPPSIISSTSEKSIFDAIREGLNFIEKNDEHVGSLLDGNLKLNITTTQKPPSNIKQSELSFLDILLGPDDEDDEDLILDGSSTSTTPRSTSINYVTSDNFKYFYTTPKPQTVITVMASPYSSTVEELKKETTIYVTQPKTVTDVTYSTFNDFLTDHSTEGYSTASTNFDFDTTEIVSPTTENDSTSTISDFTNTEKEQTESTSIETTEQEATESLGTSTQVETSSYDPINRNETTVKYDYSTISESTTSIPETSTNNEDKFIKNLKIESMENKTDRTSTNITTVTSINYRNSSNADAQFSAFLNGIAEILNDHNATYLTQNISGFTENLKLDPLTSVKRSTTPKIPNTISTTIAPLLANQNNTTSQLDRIQESAITTLTTTHAPIVEVKPLLINSNPSILETDINYDYSEPTLPPSLPNLKIIPFLPTDAVKNTRPNSNYYKIKPTNYPILTSENFENLFLSVNDQPKKSDLHGSYELEHDDYQKESKTSVGHGEFELYNLNTKSTKPNKEKLEFNNNFNIDTTGYPNDRVFLVPESKSKIKYDAYDRTAYPLITEKYDGSKVHYGTADVVHENYGQFGTDFNYDSYLEKHIADSYNSNNNNEANQFNKNTYQLTSGGGGTHLTDDVDNSGLHFPSTFEKFATIYPEKKVYGKIEFTTTNPVFGFERNNNQFSPPSKTEGNQI